jgi:hypothetical protein
MGFWNRIYLVFGVAGALVSCVRVTKEVRTEPIGNILSVKSCGQQTGTCLTMKKDKLGQRFILLASAKMMAETPTWEAFRPQIVSFKREGNFIGMYEENISTVYDDIKVEGLQQKFAIESEDENQLQVSLGEGFKTLKLIGSIEMPKVFSSIRTGLDLVQTIDSVIKSSTQSPDKIEIIQSVRISKSSLSATGNSSPGSASSTLQISEMPADVIWQIYPYQSNSDFLMVKPDPFRRVGFFTASLQKKRVRSEKDVSIIRWDPSKLIQANVSNSVPKFYRDSVKAGLEYWNKVLGKEVVKVEFVDEEHMRPGLGVVLIHWLRWEDGSGAVAKPQADPLTGELLGGHIDISEVFVSTRSARGNAKESSSLPTLGNSFCDLPTRLDFPNMTPAQKADFTVWVTAHEMGHMMGLRHNFAGSFSSGHSEASLNETYENYLISGSSQIAPTTTVMDYVMGRDSALTGAYIRTQPLAYDLMAMQYSTKQSEPDQAISAYCTDEDTSIPQLVSKDSTGSVYGCQRFDSGINPLEVHLQNLKTSQEGLVSKYFLIKARSLVEAKSKHVNTGKMENLFEFIQGMIPIHVDSVAAPLNSMAGAISRITKGSIPRLVSMDLVGNLIKAVEGDLVLVDNAQSYLMQEDKTFQNTFANDVAALGGPAKLLRAALVYEGDHPKKGWIAEQMIALSQSPLWTTLEFEDGEKYTVPDEDKQKIVAAFIQGSETLEKAYRKAVLARFFPSLTLSDSSFATTPSVSTGDFYELRDWIRRDPSEILALTETIEALMFQSTKNVNGAYGPILSRSTIELPQYQYRGTDLQGPFLSLYSSGFNMGLKFNTEEYQSLLARKLALKAKIFSGLKETLLKVDPTLESQLKDSTLIQVATLNGIMTKLVTASLVDQVLGDWLRAEIQFFGYVEYLH